MKAKKATKKELKEMIQILINTVSCDKGMLEDALVNNEVTHYSDYNSGDERIELGTSARVVIMDEMRNQKHVIKKLYEISEAL